MIWKAYKYIYYWLYTWNKSLWGEKDVPEFNAVTGMSLSLICFIMSLAVLFELLTGIQIVPSDIPKIKLIPFLLSFLFFHYFTFMYKGKYKEIEKEFKRESKKDRRRKGVFVLIYTFGSMILYVSLLFFGIWVKN